MNRDHLLGWPPSLLALDDPPVEPVRIRTYHRRPAATATSVPVIRTRLSQAEQDKRHALDKVMTLALSLGPDLDRKVNELCGTPQAQPEPWVYCKHPHDEDAVHRIRGSVVEFADPGSPRWRKTPWHAGFVRTLPVVERPSWDPDLAAAPTHTTEYRVRKDGNLGGNIYRLRDGQVEYWHRFDKCWCPPTTVRNWNDMIPAPAEHVAALPAEHVAALPAEAHNP